MAIMLLQAKRIDVKYLCKSCGNFYNSLSAIRKHTKVKHVKHSLYNNTIGVYTHTTEKEVQ
jgi:DNA-directed RNA polymerase subunit M/transcription elongation factor TFIIS